jgi:hypothetical protein
MGDLPSGTGTFLFTDIEGGTAFWERDRAGLKPVTVPQAVAAAIAGPPTGVSATAAQTARTRSPLRRCCGGRQRRRVKATGRSRPPAHRLCAGRHDAFEVRQVPTEIGQGVELFGSELTAPTIGIVRSPLAVSDRHHRDCQFVLVHRLLLFRTRPCGVDRSAWSGRLSSVPAGVAPPYVPTALPTMSKSHDQPHKGGLRG